MIARVRVYLSRPLIWAGVASAIGSRGLTVFGEACLIAAVIVRGTTPR